MSNGLIDLISGLCGIGLGAILLELFSRWDERRQAKPTTHKAKTHE